MNAFINIGNKIYNGRFNAFYENITSKIIIETLEKNTPIFLDEWIKYGDYQKNLSDKFFLFYKEKGWNTTMLYSYGLRYHNNCKHFPQTLKALENFDNIVTVYYSTLEPGTQLNPHFGDTDATYRIHLGLNVPAGLPTCGIEVGGIKKEWVTGKTIIFNDAHLHTAWNLTLQSRTVLIVDVLKPEFTKKKWLILASVLGAMGIGRTLHPFNMIKKLSPKIISLLHIISTFIFLFVLLIQRQLRHFY